MKYIVVNQYGNPMQLLKRDSGRFAKEERAIYPRGGVLWVGHTATVFQTRRQAKAAIQSSLQYSDRRRYDWRHFMDYKIVPVED